MHGITFGIKDVITDPKITNFNKNLFIKNKEKIKSLNDQFSSKS